MSRLVSRAESWEKVYLAFQNINFAAFDYNTVKRSLIDYIRLYFPETFNDYIESSEFVAIIESFAYIAELLAYRLDVNAHENFISTAQRRDSILRLARLISYKADRPIPARGLVKLTSITTTEPIVDANGINLSNVPVRWNDPANANWKDQFILVINRAMGQPFGSVSPTDRFQINNVVFELYNWNLTSLSNGVFPYSIVVDGNNTAMELVPVAYNSALGIVERRPERNANFTFLYGSDGLGDSSDTTGFFCFTKQGNLSRYTTTFDGITPNLTYTVGTTNINETDVWLNNVDPNTGQILNDTTLSDIYQRPSTTRAGEWEQIDNVNTSNIIFNTSKFRNKYEVQTLDENDVSLIFGDGEFADVPKGTFDVWVRTSEDLDLVIPRNTIVDQSASFTYVDDFNRTQTFTFTFSLINSLQNASASESIEHIRSTAPSVYATQDRMVNGEDYNTYPLQDSSILKLRAVNRTFAGDSKYIPWNDPSENYENIKIFSDDGIIFYYNQIVSESTPVIDINSLITTFIQPLLSSTDIFLQLTSNGVNPNFIRTSFNQDEITDITAAVNPPPTPAVVEMFYRLIDNQWYSAKVYSGIPDTSNFPLLISNVINYGGTIIPTNSTGLLPGIYTATITINGDVYPISVVDSIISTYQTLVDYLNQQLVNVATVEIYQGNIRINVLPTRTISTISIVDGNLFGSITGFVSIDPSIQGTFNSEYITYPLIFIEQNNIFETSYVVSRDARRIVFQSETTQFWNPNNGVRTINYDTLRSDFDRIIILKSNVDADRTGILTQNWSFDVLNQQPIDSGSEVGLPSIHQLNVIPTDTNLDRIPDNLELEDIINPSVYYSVPPLGLPVLPFTSFNIVVPIYYINSTDVSVVGDITGPLQYGIDWTEQLDVNGIGNSVNLIKTPDVDSNNQITIKIKDYVYFSRLSVSDPYTPVETTYENINSYIQGILNATNLWIRYNGRDQFNFAWFHNTPRFNLVDPAATNIIDMFIITKGYFTQLKRWLTNPFVNEPTLPTPFELRTSYGYLLDNKMISDTVVLHSGRFKLLFGSRAKPELQATFKVIKSENSNITDNQIKTTVVNVIRTFFDVNSWEFGETFFYTELAAAIHTELPNDISSVVLVPTYPQNQFGDLFQVICKEDEIFYPDIQPDQVEVVVSYNATNLRLTP